MPRQDGAVRMEENGDAVPVLANSVLDTKVYLRRGSDARGAGRNQLAARLAEIDKLGVVAHAGHPTPVWLGAKPIRRMTD